MACEHRHKIRRQECGHQYDWEPDMVITAIHYECQDCGHEWIENLKTGRILPVNFKEEVHEH